MSLSGNQREINKVLDTFSKNQRNFEMLMEPSAASWLVPRRISNTSYGMTHKRLIKAMVITM